MPESVRRGLVVGLSWGERCLVGEEINGAVCGFAGGVVVAEGAVPSGFPINRPGDPVGEVFGDVAAFLGDVLGEVCAGVGSALEAVSGVFDGGVGLPGGVAIAGENFPLVVAEV